MELKIVSFNANRNRCLSGTNSKQRILNFVERASADILCLQLVEEADVLDIVRKLGEGYSHTFQKYTNERFGIAIVTKLAQITQRENGIEDFYLKTALLLPDGNFFEVITVHLNNTSESVRLEQINKVLESSKASNTLILGDFNALCRTDYNDNEWGQLEEIASTRGWEPRTDSVYRHILQDGQMEDIGSRIQKDCTECSQIDEMYTYLLCLPERKSIPLRLDYMFVSKVCNLKVKEYKIYHALDASNHFPIMCICNI